MKKGRWQAFGDAGRNLANTYFALEVLVMLIPRMNVFGRATALGAADSGQHWLEHFLTQGQQTRQRADARATHLVAARAADAHDLAALRAARG